MHKKRIAFVAGLIALFVVCFYVMNQNLDELARYKYADDNNSEVIMEYLNTDEINYLIDRQFTPDEFMPYFGIEGFTIYNVNAYNSVKAVNGSDVGQLVRCVNLLLEKGLNVEQMVQYASAYSFESLINYYSSDSQDWQLAASPNDLLCVIQDSETVYTYEPKELVRIDTLPAVSEDDLPIYVTSQTSQALQSMCDAAGLETGYTCGNMIVTQGYISYRQAQDRYEEAILRYGKDNASKHVLMPGKDVAQLGNTVVLVPALIDIENVKDGVTAQQTWLSKHAASYGFIVVNEKEGLNKEFVLRYVGVENYKNLNAKKIEELKR